jgi:hypothetical protein
MEDVLLILGLLLLLDVLALRYGVDSRDLLRPAAWPWW